MSLNESQYLAIMRQYEMRRDFSLKQAEQSKMLLYSKYPRLLEIENEIASAAVKKVSDTINGINNADLIFENTVSKLEKERDQIFLSEGINSDYLDVKYYCPDCKDTGYIGNEKCHCLKQALLDYTYKQSNISEILKSENFTKFDFRYYDKEPKDQATGMTPYESALKAHQSAMRFIDHFNDDFANILFYGNTGVGKTFLSNCIACEILNRGYSVIYFTAFSLFDVFSKNIFQKDTDAKSQNDDILNCDLLIIDDLGTEIRNQFTVSQLFLCINERILRKKSTIISTNFDLKQLQDAYTERILSRLTNSYEMLKLCGRDIRLKKRTMLTH